MELKDPDLEARAALDHARNCSYSASYNGNYIRCDMYTKRDDSPRLRSVLVAVYPEPIEKIPQYPDDSAGDSVLASWTIDIESGDDVQSEVARGIGAAKQFIDEKEYSTDKMIEDIRAGFDEVLPGDHTE